MRTLTYVILRRGLVVTRQTQSLADEESAQRLNLNPNAKLWKFWRQFGQLGDDGWDIGMNPTVST